MKKLRWMMLILFVLLVMQGGMAQDPTYSNEESIMLTSTDINNMGEDNGLIFLSDLLSTLEQHFDVTFLYKDEVMANKYIHRDSIQIGEQTGQELSHVLGQLGITFQRIDEQTYVLLNKDQSLQSVPVQEDISGTVTDVQTGETLPGVNVIVKGTTTGTSTDSEGSFELTVESLQDTLVFSFVGYQTREVPINGRTEIDVALQSQAIAGEELVVVGYGTQEKNDLTGSVASVNAEDINAKNVAPVSVDQLLQGQAAGVQISQASSEPGGGVRVRIRGASSLNANNEPLYVIDGLPINNNTVTPQSGSGGINNQNPRNPLNSLNPSDIESIEILKDASATAIYGSRGANGVVMITTKKGQDELQLDYETSIGIQQIGSKLDVLSGQQYISVLNELREDRGEAPEFSQDEIESLGNGTDWQEEIFRDAPMQNHQFSVSGGSDKTQYYASLNYLDQQGVVENSGINRYSARLNLNRQAGESLSFGLNLNTSLIKDNFAPYGVGTNEFAGAINAAIFQDPTRRVRNEDGSLTQPITTNLENPVALTQEIYDKAETNRTFGNVFAEYQFLDNLSARINFGSDRETSRRDTYNPRVTKRGEGSGGIADASTSEASNYLVETTLNYDASLGQRHDFDILGGFTYQEFVNNFLSGSAEQFPTDAFLTNNLGSGSEATNSSSTGKNQHQLLSYLGRINYSFDSKYLLTATFRADGSSRFGEGNKYGYFPSFALGWRLSEENFISKLNIFSNLKLRVSYGITGNQGIGNYNSLSLLGLSGQAIFDGSPQVGIAPNQVPNPDLKWESTEQLNVGLNWGFLNNRLTGSIDYFVKHTSDLLVNLPIPSTTGFGTSLQNIGSVENKGLELEIGYSTPSDRNLNWTTSLNVTSVYNELTDFGDIAFSLGGGIGFAPNFAILREGNPIRSYYGYKVEGVFQEGDNIANSPQPLAQPGQLKYKDTNNDGEITPEDRTALGNPYPDFTFGFNNTISFKNLDLNIFINGSQGGAIYNMNIVESENPISFRRNRLADAFLNRWTPDNPTNKNPSFVPPEVSYGSSNNSRAVKDASYIRLQNIMVKYHIPATVWRPLRMANIYLSAQNLLTITNYEGFNPDVSSLGDSNIVADNNAYPLAKVYIVGLKLGF